jgi:hypothetical protein
MAGRRLSCRIPCDASSAEPVIDQPLHLEELMKGAWLFAAVMVVMPAHAGAGTLTDEQVRQMMIRESILSYPAICPCPYSFIIKVGYCGRRSAWSKTAGHAILCYPSDISDDMVKEYRREQGLGQ